MSQDKTNNVLNIGRNDPDALARSVGMNDIIPRTPDPKDRDPQLRLAAVGTAALAAVIIAPRIHHSPAPVPESPTQMVENAAKVPYNPATDERVFGNITVRPNSTPSQAVLDNPSVKKFEAAHPGKVSSLTTSAMFLPPAESYDVVEREVDHDSDREAIAVPEK